MGAAAPGTLGGLAGDAILDPAPAPNTPEDAVPTDPIAQAGGLAVAAAEVAAVAVPVAVGCGLLARRLGRPVVPPWRPRPAVWTGFDILFLFFLHLALLSVAATVLSASGALDAVPGPSVAADPAGAVGGAAAAAAAGERAADVRVLRGMWATVFATPALLLAGLAVRSVVHGRPVRFRLADLPAGVAFGTLAWVVATPVVFAVHFAAVYLTEISGGGVQEHPLTQLATGATAFDRLFFGLVVCLVTPLAEEFLFRGLLVRWAAGRWYRSWLLVGAGGLFAVTRGAGEEGGLSPAPVAFVAVLGVGQYALQRLGRWRGRFPVRMAVSVYATAALFAAAHSRIWPTPIPLFVLGLVLGYLAARTNRITACVVLHGLFNAVSYVYLLRGGAC
jgi:membrane protease YdiL (CAAX protease family)